ncbi:MAG: chromosomal replication initiator protein DnaA [Cytophagaceae bacterium]|nr:chromosomal replication initiator protein DnaA [Cytophagaceae bacterium]
MLLVKDCKSVWYNCLQLIKESVNEQSFKTWFEPIVPISLQQNVLTIQVPSQFFYEWLEENYVQLLRKAIDKELGSEGRLEYSVVVDEKTEAKANGHVIRNGSLGGSKNNSTSNATGIKSPFDLKELDKLKFDSQLNPQYTFETYVEGHCNRLARSAGIAVANKPGITSFNPLMIYGGVGLGKTHLGHAIGNHIKKNFKDKFVLYVSCEKFSNQYIEALKNSNIQEFYNFYLQVDVLILDDVQFLAGKEKTQEIFFQIFNHLHQSGKQIIMTSDCPPKELKGLQERLLSRFKWGLTADVQHPDFETRIAIIQKKLEAEGVAITDSVVEYLAYSIDTNIRELEGVLISLIAQASLNKKEIDLELAKQTLQSIVQDIDSEVGIDYIQKFVADYFGVTVESLKAKTRKREIVVARQVAMYFAKEYTNLSLKSIGYHFGNRDHSTVIHALTSVSDLMDTDRKFNATMQELTKKLKLKSL